MAILFGIIGISLTAYRLQRRLPVAIRTPASLSRINND